MTERAPKRFTWRAMKNITSNPDTGKPTLAEYARAAADLRSAEKILRTSPTLLAGVAEECARWIPSCLDAATVRDALASAAWCARPNSFRMAELERVIAAAIERGKKRPHLTSAERLARNTAARELTKRRR